MGWRDLFGGSKKEQEQAAPRVAPRSEPEHFPLELEPLEMTGTTTHCAEGILRVFTSRRIPDGGTIESPGYLLREPSNPADPLAVAVHANGERVGYLPSFIASQLPLPESAVAPCHVQLWGTNTATGFRAVGWVAASQNRVTWPHNQANPPAITPNEKNSQRAAAVSQMVHEGLNSADPQRRAEFKRGVVGGYHYLETVEPIKQLKREGRLEEALALCYLAIEGAENDRDGLAPAPGYTIHAAIIHRKLGQKEEEIEVLERWLRKCPAQYRKGSEVQERLDKIRAKSK